MSLPLPSHLIALALILVSTPFRVSSSSSAPACQLLQVRRQARGSNCITCKKIGFRAIPMIFLQVVQLLSQACCLPLPELLNLKVQLSNATSRGRKRQEIGDDLAGRRVCVTVEDCSLSQFDPEYSARVISKGSITEKDLCIADLLGGWAQEGFGIG